MATERHTSSSTAALPRGHQGRPAESLRERLLAGLAVTERRLSLNGVTTAVLEGGKGAPVVLLHGPGAYGAHWLRILPDLAATHRVIAPDLPGHGESGMFAGPPDPGLLSGWLDDLIECTCATPPVLVGPTLGGAIAARFAGERGERLAALVLVDALGLTEFRPTPEFGAALTDYLSAPGALTHDRLWSQCVFDLTTLRTRMGEQLGLIKAYNLDRLDAPGRLAALRSLMEQFGGRRFHSPSLHASPCRRRSSGVDMIERRRCRSRKTPASAFDGISASSTTPRTTRHWSSWRRS
jgi:pimeloyl-ACP methyl ester carboxylesterase